MYSEIKQIIPTFLLFASFVSSEIVQIEDGLIEGTKMETREGESYDAFLNIPYGEAPINELRFKPPVPAKSWVGVLNATAFGPICMQRVMGPPNPNIQISEDCLQLNVFTKNLPVNGSSAELKPVIVYFHGGAWMGGSGVDSGSVLLMQRDVVFVSVNYRLHAFGFLATGTEDAMGNMALKDKILSLKWVQKNIEKFGGDKNQVTIAGMSAGAHSVTALVVSPMARGLFHGAIAQSGGITWQPKFETNNLQMTRQVAERVNCTTANITEMVICLQQTPAMDIAVLRLNQYSECPVLMWSIVIEPDFGQERFFVEQPDEAIKSGNFNKVPVIIGVTEDEWLLPVPRVFNNPALMREFNENFDEVAPICFFYESGTNLSKALSKKFREFYFPLDIIDERSFSGFNHLFSEGIIGYGAHRFAQLVSNFSDVYYYKFSYLGRFSTFRYPSNQPYGVMHGDDRMYVTPSSNANIDARIGLEDPENVMIERLTRIFAQFAATG